MKLFYSGQLYLKKIIRAKTVIKNNLFLILYCQNEKYIHLRIQIPNSLMSKIFALSEASSIAIHSMVLIARAKEGINAVKVAEITGFSKNHIAKVLQRLVKNDMLKSVRGPAGGFSLKQDPKSISLLDIYQAIEGALDIGDCPLSYEVCGFDQCLMGNVVNKLTIEFKKFLQGQTLQKYL